MIDYDDLMDRLNNATGMPDITNEAASAIKALLRERDIQDGVIRILEAQLDGGTDPAWEAAQKQIRVIEEWTKPQTIRLRAGEMTAQEMRTVQAVMRGLLEAVKEAQG